MTNSEITFHEDKRGCKEMLSYCNENGMVIYEAKIVNFLIVQEPVIYAPIN